MSSVRIWFLLFLPLSKTCVLNVLLICAHTFLIFIKRHVEFFSSSYNLFLILFFIEKNKLIYLLMKLQINPLFVQLLISSPPFFFLHQICVGSDFIIYFRLWTNLSLQKNQIKKKFKWSHAYTTTIINWCRLLSNTYISINHVQSNWSYFLPLVSLRLLRSLRFIISVSMNIHSIACTFCQRGLALVNIWIFTANIRIICMYKRECVKKRLS